MIPSEKKQPKIVIVGAGPCGLGAAFRLQELQHDNFVVLDQATGPGGLAQSDVDPQGFTWDFGTCLFVSSFATWQWNGWPIVQKESSRLP